MVINTMLSRFRSHLVVKTHTFTEMFLLPLFYGDPGDSNYVLCTEIPSADLVQRFGRRTTDEDEGRVYEKKFRIYVRVPFSSDF